MNTPDISALTACLRNSSVDALPQLSRRLEEDQHGLSRLGVLLDIAEFCIKFRAVYVLSECRRVKIPLPGKVGVDFRKPTFGDWAGVLRDGSKARLKHTGTKIAVPDLLSDESLNESIQVLVDARNSRAHGATPSASQALVESERIIKHVIGVAWAFQTEKWDLLGEQFGPDEKSITVSGGSHWSRPYLRTRADGRMTTLFPWLVMEENSKGSFLLIFNRDNQTESEPGSLDYLDYGSGEERDLATEYRGDVQDELKLFKLANYGPNWQSHSIDRHRKYYVGRENELEQLRNFVESGTEKVQIVTGWPGFGKTALLAQLLYHCDTIRHFVTDDAPSGTKAILKNLHRQLEARSGSLDAGTVQNTDDNSVCSREVIVIDGLDEAEDWSGLLKKLRTEGAFEKSRFIFGAQRHVRDDIMAVFGDDGVIELELAGLSLDQTKKLAELYDLFKLSQNDIVALHKRTQGGPLFLRAVLHDLTTDHISLADLHSLPEAVEEYWAAILCRHNPTGVKRNPDSVRHLKRISADAFQRILNDWNVEPIKRGTLSKAFGKEVDRRLQMELTVFLGMLATSPLPLSVAHLTEIVPTTDEQFVQNALKDLGSLVDVEGFPEEVKLCHGSLRNFLLHKREVATEDAKSLLRAWAENWIEDSAGVRAKVYCSLCDDAELIAMLNDWAFLELFLHAWGFDETMLVYEKAEGVQEIHLAKPRLEEAFHPIPRKLVADMNLSVAGQPFANRGGARVITEHDARCLERKEERAAEEDETDDFADMEHLDQQKKELEASWKQRELPSEWFGDWTSCEQTMSRMRDGYTQVLDLPPSLEEPAREERQYLQIAEFLKHCKRQLSASKPDIPLIAYNSGVFRDTPLDLQLKERVNQSHKCWIEREHRRTASHYANVEALHREIGYNFCVSHGSSIVCYVRYTSAAPNEPELVCEDWQEISQSARVLLPHRAKQSMEVLCLSYDGRYVLVEITEREKKPSDWTSRLAIFDTADGGLVREFHPDSGRKFKRLFDATPDLAIMLVDLDGKVALMNSITGAVTELPLLDNIGYADFGRISRDGRLVIFRRRYGQYVGFDTAARCRVLHFASFWTGEKSANFEIDPSGGLYLEKGRLYSLAEGICVRDFDKCRAQDCAAFSLDSRILVIAAENVLRAYDVRMGQQIGEYPLREQCSSVVLSADGSLALLKTLSDNLLVVDLLKSAVGLGDPPTLKKQEAIPAHPGDRVAYFWNDENASIVKYWRKPGGISTQETNTAELELSVKIPGSEKYQSTTPLFKAGEEIWFECNQNLQFSVLHLGRGKVVTSVSLLDDSAPPGLVRKIQDNLNSLYQARIATEPTYSFPHPWLDGTPFPIDTNHVAIGIFPNLLAIIDVARRCVEHWVSWGKPPSSALDLRSLCAREKAVYALTSNNELLIWNWRDNRGVEVINTMPYNLFYAYNKSIGICGENLTVNLTLRKEEGFIEIYEIENKRVVEKPVDINGFRWGTHFIPITNQPLFLASLEPLSSNLTLGNQLALVDVKAGCVIASISFESTVTQMFRLGGDTFGVALDDGSIEAIIIHKNDSDYPSG